MQSVATASGIQIDERRRQVIAAENGFYLPQFQNKPSRGRDVSVTGKLHFGLNVSITDTVIIRYICDAKSRCCRKATFVTMNAVHHQLNPNNRAISILYGGMLMHVYRAAVQYYCRITVVLRS